jgi:hypothetical protein
MTAPLRERLANNAFTTLDGNINNSVTSIDVTDGSVFPATGNFRLTVSQEIMLCTARSGNTLTVVRGYEGTGAASHSDLDNIVLSLTAGAVDRWAKDNDAFWGATGRPPLGVISNGAGGILTLSDFTWVHQGTATASDQNGTILMRAPPASGENARMLVRTAPSPPWTVIAAFEGFGIVDGGVPTLGLLARQSSSGKFFGGTINSEGTFNRVFSWAAYTLASPTSFNSTILSRENGRTTPFGRYFWMKLEDDGTDLKFYGSYDGLYWHLLATHDRDSYMTSGGPDQFGWYINNYNSTNWDMLCRLCAWSHS